MLSFFFTDTAPPELYSLSLHDALPIFIRTWVDGTQFVHFSAFLSGRDHTFDRCDRGTVFVLVVWYRSWTSRFGIHRFYRFWCCFRRCRLVGVVYWRRARFAFFFKKLLFIGFVTISQTHSDHGFLESANHAHLKSLMVLGHY